MTHDDLRKQTLIDANKFHGVRLWPNPIGLGMAGKVVKRFTKDGKSYALIENPRQIKFGLAKGSSDCIGFKTENIGKIKIARFLGVEIKVGRDTLKEEQENYMNMVNSHGGCAGVVRNNTSGLVDIFGRELKRAD